jgi:hypothetical protein
MEMNASIMLGKMGLDVTKLFQIERDAPPML